MTTVEAPTRRTKILTVCQAGTSRSVALAHILKYRHNVDAIPLGWQANSPETLRMVGAWADRIIQLQNWNLEHIWLGLLPKVRVADVGYDVWSNSMHPELHGILTPWTDDWAARHFAI